MLIYISLQKVQLLRKVQSLHNVQSSPIIAQSTWKYQMHLETVILAKVVCNVILVIFLEIHGIVLFHQLVLRCLSNRFLQIIVEQKWLVGLMAHIHLIMEKLWKGTFALSIFGTKIPVGDLSLWKFKIVDHFTCISYQIHQIVFQDTVLFREIYWISIWLKYIYIISATTVQSNTLQYQINIQDDYPKWEMILRNDIVSWQESVIWLFYLGK